MPDSDTLAQMLISKQRHERELSEAIAKATRLNEEILGGLPQGVVGSA